MFLVSILSTILFILPTNKFIIAELFLLFLFMLVTKKDWVSNLSKEFKIFKKINIGTFIIGITEIFVFYFRWRYFGVLVELSKMIGISNNVFVFVISCIFSAMSLPFVNFILRKGTYALEEKASILRKKDYLFSAVVSILTAQFFDIRPFVAIDNFTNVDSAVFIYIGRMMHKGFIPYKDLFDHKGPILYLIQYLGTIIKPMFFSVAPGVWMLEVVNLFIFCLFLLKILKLFINNDIVGYLSIWIAVFVCGQKSLIGGNFTEEYALPWIALSLYIFLKFFKYNSYKKIDIILLGICFSIVFMLRQNMISLWLAFIPSVLIIKLLANEYKDILICILLFVLGCALILVPTCFYLSLTNSLKDMFAYYFDFNFLYSAANSSAESFIDTVIYLSTLSSITIPSALLALIMFNGNKLIIWNTLFFIVSIIVSSISGNNYYHYATVLIPATVVYVAFALENITCRLKMQTNNKHFFVMVVLIVLSITNISSELDYSFSGNKVNVSYKTKEIVNHSEPEDDVVIIGNNCAYYLNTERYTKIKYFYQFPPIIISDEMCNEFINQLVDVKPEVIVISEEESIKKTESYLRIKETLDYFVNSKDYEFVENINMYLKNR